MGQITDREVEEMLAEMEDEAIHFLREEYGMELQIPIKANGRIKRVLGRYRTMNRGKEPSKIELSKVIMSNGYDKTLDVLKHELIHYALHVKGKPNKDSDEYFIQECNRLGVSLTRHYLLKNLKAKKAVIECEKCGDRIYRFNKIPERRGYTHTGCGGKVYNVGYEIV